MDADDTKEPTPTDGTEASNPPTTPPAAPNSAGSRLQATLATADTAAKEILDAARADAREHVERIERAAIARTEQLQRHAELLVEQAAQLTQLAGQLGTATRELTTSIRSELAVDVEEMTEVAPSEPELGAPATEPEADEGPAPTERGHDEPAAPSLDDHAPPPGDQAPEHEPEPSAEGSGAPRRSLLSFLRREHRDADADLEAPAEEVPPAARLEAAQMLVSGLEKAEVERRLRDRFGITDPQTVTEALLERPGIADNPERGEDR